MPALSNKTILIISPQDWGIMFLSKHHYAIELARRGNKVYFLNPPTPSVSRGRVEITPSGIVPDLWFIRHNLRFPYKLKFHALPLFHALMRSHVRRIMRTIGRPVDIVWSFDLGWLYPFSFFGKTLKVFHPVDEPLTIAAIRAARGADALFAVTREIVEKYVQFPIPGHFINHGVSGEFLQEMHTAAAIHTAAATGAAPIRIGFSGNLLRPDIDREIFLQIIRENPAIQFECWGSYKDTQSNIGGASDSETQKFVNALLALPNAILHGPIPPARLAQEIRRMDGFLICYDIEKDQSKGTNYHKIMEYISTGKVIISNNVTTYKDQPDLIQMTASRTDNRQLPDLFRKVTGDLSHFNSPALMEKRISFARNNSYEKQLGRIEAILENLEPPQTR